MISTISTGFRYLACIEMKLSKMRSVYFLKLYQMQSHSHCVFVVLYLKDQKDLYNVRDYNLLESIYCSRTPLIVASIAVACQVHVIIYVFKVK